MEVILKSDIKGLGSALEVVQVKPGYAQNFLFPKQLASQATPENLKILESDRKVAEEVYLKEKNKATELADKLQGVSVTIAAKTSEGDKLYGSVTSKEIVAKLKEGGFEIDRKQVQIADPIKSLGMYSIKIQLHNNIDTKIKLWVINDESSDASKE